VFGFVFGVLVGFGVKMAYDFIQEERIPADLGMAQGRSEAVLDETRQIVRELRDEVRALASGDGAPVAAESDAPKTSGGKASGGKGRQGTQPSATTAKS